jgi:pyruvate formate lyase activating enzyme
MDNPLQNGDLNQALPSSANVPTGLVFNLMRFSLHDGPGIRTTVFLKGCPLRCSWCHNPESQARKEDVIYYDERCLHCGDCVAVCPHGALTGGSQPIHDPQLCQLCGVCVEACSSSARRIVGRSMTVQQVMTELLKDEVFFDESRGGVTISGGEPLFQAEFTLALLAACKARRLHTVLDTCGFAPPEVLSRAAQHVDLFHYDLKLMDSERHFQATGVRNGMILDNLIMLAESGSKIIIRVPVIPGINDDSDNFTEMSAFLAQLGLRRIDLLPYHRMGSEKYRRLHMASAMEGVEPPATDTMNAIAARFKRDGFQVQMGD